MSCIIRIYGSTLYKGCYRGLARAPLVRSGNTPRDLGYASLVAFRDFILDAKSSVRRGMLHGPGAGF